MGKQVVFARLAVALILMPGLLPGADAVAQTRLTPEQRLGRRLFKDRDLSLGRNQACASCHSLGTPRLAAGGRVPTPGFVDPRNVARGTPVSPGSVEGRFGHLNAPSVGYAAFSPFFHWDAGEGLYVGGQFWNGRASTLAEQAAAPFLNPDEMAMPSRWAVVSRLKENPRHVRGFARLFGVDLDQIADSGAASASAPAPPGVEEAYDDLAQAIAEFEKSRRFNRFTSKFDFVIAGETELSAVEARGLEVFEAEDAGNCAACHTSAAGIAPDGGVLPPLFTDFTYDNIGLPRNVEIPGNPEPDAGLGGRADVAAGDPDGFERGKQKVMSLRNIAVTPPYGHNGVFESLEEIVHFYNTRDVLGVVADSRDPGFAVTGWPAPEIPENVNVDELGDLGLGASDEAALVAFLLTLTDGYPEWGGDPLVPPGTPSPFAETALPPFP